MTGPIIEPPGINALVQVDVGPTGAEVVESVPSRVEDLEGRDLFIAAPGPPSAVPPAAGTRVLLRWTGPRGLHSLETELVEVQRGGVHRWRLSQVGAVQTQQRRSFARAFVATPVVVVALTEEEAVQIPARLVDLSEGGVRARIDEVELVVDGPVEVHLELEAVPVVLPGRVTRCAPVPGSSGTFEVVMVIESGVHARRIRRAVMKHQLLSRRGGGR